MTETSTAGPAAEVMADLITTVEGDLLVVLPRPVAVRTLVEALDEVEFAGGIRLLTSESTAKQIRREFLTATHLVDLIETGTLNVRTVTEAGEPRHSLLIGPEHAATLVWPPGDSVGATVTNSDSFRTAVSDSHEALWADAEEFSFLTPGYSRLLGTLAEEFGGDLRDDVVAELNDDATQQALGDTVDAVDVMILVAAKHREQLYEISRWGERVGLASPAKFSNAKQRFENEGLIETEKVPVERGRPRQRLVPGPELPDGPAFEAVLTSD